jgi:hypothetical protein
MKSDRSRLSSVLRCMRTTIALLVLLSGMPSSGLAQSTPAAAANGELPVSLNRIKRELDKTGPRERSTADGLRLNYYLDVYGKLPSLEMFRGFDLQFGPVPFGGPTHTEFLQLVTPQEFRSPPANLSNVAQAIAQWLSQRSAEKKAREKQ